MLDRVPDLESGDKERRRAAEVALVAFMVTAAWGYSPVSDIRYGSRYGRFLHLSRMNEDIYKLARGAENTSAHVHCRSGRKTFELGRAIGFSAVMPLTPAGYRNYCLNGKAMSDLGEGDIVPGPYERNTVPFVLITGAVDFRALAPYLGGIRRFPRTAHALLATLGGQVGDFIPRLKLWQERGLIYAEPQNGRKLPTILCPLSGHGMGGDLLRTAGFKREGEDARGNRVWTLDLEEINGRRKGDRYLKKLFKANRYIDRCRDSPARGILGDLSS